MSGADDIFGAFNAQARQMTEENRQHGFEEWVVKSILRYAQVSFNVGKAVKEAQRQYDSSVLDLRWFQDNYPQFPVLLATSKLPHTSGTKIGWTALFGRNFAKLPWFVEYQKCIPTHDWDIHSERCALVFHAPHADKAGTMVLHNQPIQATIVEDPEQRTEPETRILRPYGRPRVVYVIESFTSFMQTVGTSWADDLCQHHS